MPMKQCISVRTGRPGAAWRAWFGVAGLVAMAVGGCGHARPGTEPWGKIPPPPYQSDPSGQPQAATVPAQTQPATAPI